ncbi:zinc finger protein OZF-like [Ischnura elegans]|uniref:zinc finger protein OZF-like n=1 Tax=Ischnura elegans TaxID=197161 RepID=UPI001ED8B18D|nr:zinc finger protein OZF-like [Ischnura elegans]
MALFPMASGYGTDSGAVTFHQEEERMLSQGNSETFCVLNGDTPLSYFILTNVEGNAESNCTYEIGGNVPMNENDGDAGGEWFGQGGDGNIQAGDGNIQAGDGNIQAGSSELLDENPVSHERSTSTIGVQCYDCTKCAKLFSQNDHLKSHMLTHCGQEPYECSGDGNVQAGSPEPVDENPVSHEWSTRTIGVQCYGCTECAKLFSWKTNLQSHLLTHTEEKPYVCTYCPRSFYRNSNLQSHMYTHAGEKPYQCGICPKAFTQKDRLQTHMFTHTGDRPYQCSECDKTFTSNSLLQRHMNTHSGQRPYECSVCSKSFTRNTDLRCHMRTHTGQKPYECTVCKKVFSRSSNLKSHMYTHWRKTIYQQRVHKGLHKE